MATTISKPAVALIVIALLVGCGSAINGAGQAGKGGSVGTGQAGTVGTAGTGGTGGTGGDTGPGGRGGSSEGGKGGSSSGGTAGASAGTGGGGTGGICVWANGGGDPQPGPLSCAPRNWGYNVQATMEGSQLRLAFTECDGVCGLSLCFDRGRWTNLHVEVLGSWATILSEGNPKPTCAEFRADLLPESATSEGWIRVTGAFVGADQCHQPLSCPIDDLLRVTRESNGRISVGFPPPPSTCAITDAPSSSCGGMSFSCPLSLATYCAGRTTGNCAPTWAAALDDKTFCGTSTAPRTFTCGDYNVRVAEKGGAYRAAFYDASSGMLVANMLTESFGTYCMAGASSFTPPSCVPVDVQSQSCPQAGDAGTANDGSASN